MNKEIIKVTTGENGKKLVSARDLHKFLELSKRFSAWMETYIGENSEYGFEKDLDYTSVLSGTVVNNGANRELEDYAITIEMAKELSMLSKSKKGKEARQYFISCEKQLQEVNSKANLLLSIYSGGQEAILASKQLTELEVQEATIPLLETIEEQKPLVEFAEHVSNSSNSIDMGQFAKVIKDENINIGRNRLFEWMRANKFLDKNNVPYQSKIEQGLFTVIEIPFKTPYGNKITVKTLVTGKGQLYFVEKLRKELNKNIKE